MCLPEERDAGNPGNRTSRGNVGSEANLVPFQVEENVSEEKSGLDGDQEQAGKSRRESLKGGIRQGIGMLTALKDAIEETLNEARERGDLTPERAKEAIRATLDKAQAKAGEAKDALDFVNQKQFDALRMVVDNVKERLSRVEQSAGLDADDPSLPSSDAGGPVEELGEDE